MELNGFLGTQLPIKSPFKATHMSPPCNSHRWAQKINISVKNPKISIKIKNREGPGSYNVTPCQQIMSCCHTIGQGFILGHSNRENYIKLPKKSTMFTNLVTFTIDLWPRLLNFSEISCRCMCCHAKFCVHTSNGSAVRAWTHGHMGPILLLWLLTWEVKVLCLCNQFNCHWHWVIQGDWFHLPLCHLHSRVFVSSIWSIFSSISGMNLFVSSSNLLLYISEKIKDKILWTY